MNIQLIITVKINLSKNGEIKYDKSNIMGC